MLKAQNISYKVGDKTLLDHVSVEFHPGKLNLIIGPNGAGKSTLIKVLSNELRPSTGSVFYGKENINKTAIEKLAKVRAVLSQNIELAFPLPVSEIVMMGRYPHFNGAPTVKDHLACREALRFFELEDMAERNYATLSGGEKQRVHFARVTAQLWYPINEQCRYLILDEPLTFLDVHFQFDLMYKLLALLKNTDMVIVGVVHDLNLAAKFADQITLIHQGQILANGAREDVLTKANIKNAYRLDPLIRHEGDGMYLYF